MPPVYHYSQKTDSVNEIELVGTPLGSFYDEEFDRYQVDFEDGRCISPNVRWFTRSTKSR